LHGHRIFFDKDSPEMEGDKKSVVLDMALRGWDFSKSVVDKIRLLLASCKGRELSPALENQLRELTNLRNIIAHGIVYKTVYLVEPISVGATGGTYNIIDTEDKIEWAQKFPNLKFPLPRDLNEKHARTVIHFVCEVLKELCRAFKQPIFVTTWNRSDGLKLHDLHSKTNIEEFINEISQHTNG
jgi:hypothetical protein